MSWQYPASWKPLRNPHLRMLLMRHLHEASDKRNGHHDPRSVSSLVALFFDQSRFAESPTAEIGNALFDEEEGRCVYRVAQSLLKAVRPHKPGHKIQAADWAMVRTLAQGACIILVRKGVGQFKADEAASPTPSQSPPAEPSPQA